MNTEIKIDIKRCIIGIIKKWWLIAGVTILSVCGVSLLTLNVDPDIYSAEATVYSVSYEGEYESAMESANVMRTYLDVINSNKVADRAALILDDTNITGAVIKNMITISASETSTVIGIIATSTDEMLVQNVANAVAEAFVTEIQNITGESNVQILDKADTSSMYSSGKTAQTTKRILGGIIGFIIIFAIVCGKEIFSNEIHCVRECDLDGNINILGIIPVYDEKE